MDIGPLIGALVAVAVAAVLVWVLILGRRSSPLERNLTPLLSTSCTVRLGHLGFLGRTNYMSVRLAIYRDFLVLGFLTPVVIPFSRISKVEIRPGFLTGRRLCIETAYGTAYRMALKDPESVAALVQTGASSADAKSSWACRNCGERNPDEFELCWKCQTAKT